jgi:3-hydroxy-9,10-secoandrosta-1,3,5(10)-triene-9,17-dione monooxygenase
VVGIAATGAWAINRGSEQLQEEIFGADPDARIAGSGTPSPARREQGGLRLNGRWGYASGSPHATWAALVATVTDDSGQPPDAYFCLVPAAQLRLEDTWRSALVGTLLGLGRAALALAIDKAPSKSMHHTFFARQSDSVGVQVQVPKQR